MELLIWMGILFCVSQSAMFSGLNLAYFSIPRLRLEIEAKNGDQRAARILDLREDSNQLLATILWGNVGINVLLTLLSDSVMTGLVGFFFSTFAITIFGEIFPQGYFSRHALRMGNLLYPVIQFYKILLYPLAKPSAMMMAWLLGGEGISYYKEKGLIDLIKKHMGSDDAPEISTIEGTGAINFLSLDDMPLVMEGEKINPASILQLPFKGEHPVLPDFVEEHTDPFIQLVNQSGEKWVVLTDQQGHPRLVLDADGFLRSALWDEQRVNIFNFCFRPILVQDPEYLLENVLGKFEYQPEHPEDDVIDKDVIIVWTKDAKRIITGSDILGRLMRGISRKAISTPPPN